MALKSVGITFTSECPHCKNPLPVNQASETTLCSRCWREAPTPLNVWEFLIAGRIVEAGDMEPETDSWATIMNAVLGGVRLTFGNLAPRCGGCGAFLSLESLFALAKEGDAKFSCGACGAVSSVRVPPPWFGAVAPFAVLLVGETAPDGSGIIAGSPEGVGMRCYHCGGPLPLDGSSRTVKCTHCGQDLLVPDDIWVRLYPAVAAHPWYILLDTGEAAAMLPGEIDDFIDLAALPGGDTALLWEENSEGRIGRADRSGGFRWLNKKIPLDDYARLLYASEQNLLWVLDREKDIVQAFRADTGAVMATIKKKKNKPDFTTAVDHEGIAASTDGTLLVYRCWEDDNYALRRFDPTGKRVRLWPGGDDGDLPKKRVEWDELKDRPARPPDGAWIEGGPKGALYFIERETGRFASFDREGALRGIVKPDCAGVEKIQDCGVSGDGSVYVLFDHSETINDLNFSHVGRISPDGSFKVLAGPHAGENSSSLGTDMEHMSVAENGEIHLCDRGFDNFRILAPDGSLLWRSPATIKEDETRAEELAEAQGS
ncbi:MAG: hypothetical protein KA369_17690 [Spirochaetes bacterium]|nr:hypothetical protein [Spirochaetota bacterium]